MEVRTIELRGVLPRVFAGDSGREAAPSAVWLAPSLTLDCRAPRRYLVEAESGAGKSSMCSFIYGLRDDYLGTILFDGRDIRTLTPDEWTAVRRTSLAYLPQDLLLFPELTARENVQVKNSLTAHRSAAEVDDMLCRLGLADRLDTPTRRMSVGQQQRVAIVRALCQPFTAILLDEPVSHLDARHNALASALICEEAARQGAAVISTSVGNPLTVDNATVLTL